MRHREAAVAAIAAGVSIYELMCPQNETISEFFDPHMEKPLRRAALLGAGAITLLHLANIIPERIDPYEQGLSRIRQAYKRRQHGTTC